MRVLITGGTGILGRAFQPLAEASGYQARAPGRAELDLFDPDAEPVSNRRFAEAAGWHPRRER